MSSPAIPPSAVSRCELVVRFCETDLMGIVHHGNYLAYFELGRVDWLHRRGVPYNEWAERGVHLPVVDASLRYRKPARFGDTLVVETTCAEVTRVTVRYDYRIFRGETLLCEGSTRLACTGNDMAPKRLPADVLEVLRRPELQPPSGAPPSGTSP